MNIRHTLGFLLALLMLPALLGGALWHLVTMYFHKGDYLCELFCEELDAWMEVGNDK